MGTNGAANGQRPPAWRALGLLAALAVLAVLCLLSVWLGSKEIPVTAVWQVLWHNDGSTDAVVIHSVRIPRTLLAVAVGAALGLAGALMQALTRNPLAEPGLLGVNAGAAFAIVFAIAVLGVSSLYGYIWFAFAGALGASVVVYVLGNRGRTEASPVRLALAGVAVTALLSSFTSALVLTDPVALNRYRFWSAGFAGRAGVGVAGAGAAVPDRGGGVGAGQRARAEQHGAGRRHREGARPQAGPGTHAGHRGGHAADRSARSRSRGRSCSSAW